MSGSNERLGRHDAQTGDGVYTPEGTDAESVTPPERALIHVYTALGLSQTSVAERLDRSPKTVRNVLKTSRERVENGADPLEVYAERVGYAVLVGPHGTDGGDAE